MSEEEDYTVVSLTSPLGTLVTKELGYSIFGGLDAVDLGGQIVTTKPVVAGPEGPPGAVKYFDYQMPWSQTTALIEHDLGRDPVYVQVIVDGTVRDEYSVSFPLPGHSVLVGFDVSVQALIRLI